MKRKGNREEESEKVEIRSVSFQIDIGSCLTGYQVVTVVLKGRPKSLNNRVSISFIRMYLMTPFYNFVNGKSGKNSHIKSP